MPFDPAATDFRIVVLAVGLFVSLLLVSFALFGGNTKGQRRLRQRINQVNSRSTGRVVMEKAVSVRLNTTDSSFASVDRLLKAVIPNPEVLRARLRKTGRRISIGEYVLANIVLFIATAVLTQRFTGFPLAPCLLLGVVVGLGAPHVFIGYLGQRRLKKFTELFPEAIDLIVRGLKSGLPVIESVKVVAEEMQDPIALEFRAIADSIKLGATLDEALWEAAKRLDTPEFKFFVISLSVQQETGGNLAETLDNLGGILRQRRQMRIKIKAMSGEARASAAILGALPFLLFLALYLLNPGYVLQLFEDPRGMMMLGAALTSMTMGVLVMMKMIKFEI